MAKTRDFYFIDAQGGLHTKNGSESDIPAFEEAYRAGVVVIRRFVNVSDFLPKTKTDLSTRAGVADARERLEKAGGLPDDVKARLAAHRGE